MDCRVSKSYVGMSAYKVNSEPPQNGTLKTKISYFKDLEFARYILEQIYYRKLSFKKFSIVFYHLIGNKVGIWTVIKMCHLEQWE